MLVIDYSQTINKYTNLIAYPLPNIEENVDEISQNRVFSTIDLKSANGGLSDTFAYVDNVTICGKNQFEYDKNLHRFLDAAKRKNLVYNEKNVPFLLES